MFFKYFSDIRVIVRIFFSVDIRVVICVVLIGVIVIVSIVVKSLLCCC